MATWAIGDVHGCFRTLQALLDRMEFDVRRDRLWMVGDLVNRGPRSHETLRWARALDAEMSDRFRVVLGNHDLHLIARHLGVAGERPRDTLAKVLEAADARELVDWLRRRPFVHFERIAGRDYVLVHAGLRPGWAPEDVTKEGRRLERKLQGPKATRLFQRRNKGSLVTFTRMRMLDRKGEAHDYSGPPEDAPPGLRPWFRAGPRSCPEHTIVCGHWAALGLQLEPDFIALDTGCVWGGRLTAVRLDDRRVVQEVQSDSRPVHW
ncbi:MAG: symmetrical bis(5'-nucleosyl)-tetraphosphatase [Holophagales bacterium]|nr:symmetrical bis(5'-nucleosyl)-tetraphosphatase [Holophagales bacterium]MYG31254.1 symmetrical bis(5'-nucleosyl)-tetraphosphatase [Holophagales bacterium]MYI78848.1 symmetrical bis(5'-nucleosyl)-tetraphosphatase [Holophagales bacterium]